MSARPVADDAGDRHQRRLAAAGVRRAMGSYYTPPDVVDRLLGLALDPVLAERAARGSTAVAALRVLDPSCGSGNVLVAAASRIAGALVRSGVPDGEARATAFGRCVVGIDLDPEAVRLSRRALREASGGAITASATTRQVVGADALLLPELGPRPSWSALQRAVGAEAGFDVVVGNPPFRGQLDAATAHPRRYAASLRERFGPAVGSYTDPASLFLLLAVARARADGGVAALIEPLSFLSARDAGGVRRAVLADAGLRDLWVARDRIFDAAVQVCAPVLVRGRPTRSVALHRDRTFTPAGSTAAPRPHDASWAGPLASLLGVPDRAPATAGTLADLASATADFRDQYYGLAGHVVDAEHDPDGRHPRLVTSGLIDVGGCDWGRTATAHGRTTFRFPRVDVAGLDEAMAAWARRRLVPKVLVATQTKVLEAVVDEAGAWLPSVPVISVVAAPDDLWRVAAVLSSPPATMVAARRHLGAARHGDALKLSAKEVLRLPLPAHRAAWDEAADHLRAGRTDDAARSMLAAYGLADDDELLVWWTARRPRPAASRPPVP